MCSECIAVVVQRKHTGLMPRRRGSNPTAASNSGDYSNTQNTETGQVISPDLVGEVE